MRPTGNCRPALLLLETAFLALFPLPRPDMIASRSVSCYVSCKALYGVSYCSFEPGCLLAVSYVSVQQAWPISRRFWLQSTLPNLALAPWTIFIGPLALLGILAGPEKFDGTTYTLTALHSRAASPCRSTSLKSSNHGTQSREEARQEGGQEGRRRKGKEGQEQSRVLQDLHLQSAEAGEQRPAPRIWHCFRAAPATLEKVDFTAMQRKVQHIACIRVIQHKCVC